MSLEAATEKIKFISRGKGDGVQILTEGDMIVPDINPDIYQILKADEDVIIDKVKAEQGRIGFSGRIAVSVLYYGKKTDSPVSFMKAEFPIEDYIMTDDTDENSDADITAEIIHTDYRLVNDRKINVKAVTGIKPSWSNGVETEAVKTVGGDDYLQSKTGIINTGDIRERITEEFNIRETLNIPAGKPDIAEILETTADICRREVRVSDGTAHINGDLRINIMYISADEKPVAQSAEFTVPFDISADVPMGDPFCMVRLKPFVTSAEIEGDISGDPRAVDINILITAVIKVFGQNTQTLLEDAYSLAAPLEITRKNVDYTELFGRNRAQGIYRGTVTADSSQPEMMQIVKAWGNIRNGNVTVEDNIITAEGTADMKLMYIAKDDNMPLNIAQTSVPFSQVIEIKGVKEGMTADVVTEIEDIAFSILSDREAEIRITLSFDAVVCENKSREIISDIKESDDAEDIPVKGGAVIYTVKKGDSLWSIAKKYHTTINDILELNKNKIEDPDVIYPGQRFLILKKFV